MQVSKFLSRALLGFATAVAMVASTLAVSSPASASAKWVGSGAIESRCRNSPYFLCLYYHGSRTSGSYWAFGLVNPSVDNDLGNNRFFSGTGAGAGATVRNAAAGMQCEPQVAFYCWSYVYPSRVGDADYQYSDESGTLYYTWNNEASVWFGNVEV